MAQYEVADELPPALSGAGGGTQAKYVAALEFCMANPGKWVKIATGGQSIRSQIAAFYRSHAQGGAYSRFPLDEMVFASRLQPDSSVDLWAQYKP